MTRTLPYLAALLVALALVSCSSNLSRSAAAKMITQRLEAAEATHRIISTKTGFWVKSPEELEQVDGEIGQMVRLGYFKCEYFPEHVTEGTYLSPPRSIPARCGVELSEKGIKESANWKVTKRDDGRTDTVRIPIAKAELVEVTGVTMQGNDAALVTYTYRMKPLNDIGEEMANKDQVNGTAQFRKFDDGWRLL